MANTSHHLNLLRERTLPDWITIIALAMTLAACIALLQMRPEYAIIFFVFAFLFDLLDGAVARATQTSTPFGKFLDSFADFFGYILGSTLFVITTLFDSLSFAYGVSLIMIICGVLRLCRFNVEGFVASAQASDGARGGTPKLAYTGFPVPVLSATVFILYFLKPHIDQQYMQIASASAIVVVSLLMISNIQIKKAMPFLWLPLVILFLCLSLKNILA